MIVYEASRIIKFIKTDVEWWLPGARGRGNAGYYFSYRA